MEEVKSINYPYSQEAEQAVLGAVLVDGETFSEVAELLREDDFFLTSNKTIFGAMAMLFNTNKPIDIVTVSEQLRENGSLDAVGGLAYLSQLALGVPTTENIRHYAGIIEDHAALRRLILAGQEIVAAGIEGAGEVPHIMDFAEQKLFDVMQKRHLKGFTHIKDVMADTFEQLQERAKNSGKLTGVPSGFTDLDMITSGFQPSDLIILAARPAMGKTSFALNIAEYAAINAKVPTAIFSLEMSKEQLVTRLMSSQAMIDSKNLRDGTLSQADWDKLTGVIRPMTEAPIYIDDTPGITVTDIRAKCRRIKNLGLIVIDYLQLMQGSRRSENRQQEISEISRSLKILAKEFNVPVITLSQLSRSPDSRTDKRPMISDLRESGAIEQDADIVMFLYRDDYYNPESEKKNITECIIAKHRNGSIGKVELLFLSQHTKFANKYED